jgi:beta-lactamase regulating signal transducer with metallopeptidase domain
VCTFNKTHTHNNTSKNEQQTNIKHATTNTSHHITTPHLLLVFNPQIIAPTQDTPAIHSLSYSTIIHTPTFGLLLWRPLMEVHRPAAAAGD